MLMPTPTKPPFDATYDERVALLKEYAAEIVKCNPRHFLPPGVRKRWYHFRLEYPRMLLESKECACPGKEFGAHSLDCEVVRNLYKEYGRRFVHTGTNWWLVAMITIVMITYGIFLWTI